MTEIDAYAIIGGITLFFGVVFTLVSVLIRNVRKKHNKNWVTIQALVISFLRKISIDDSNGYTYFPIFQFEVEGKTIQAQGGFGYHGSAKVDCETGNGLRSDFKVGNIVEILYNPQNPEKATIKNSPILNTITRVFLVVGVLLLAVSVIVGILGLYLRLS